MRFFTPELYLQFNSADDEEADRANEAWEGAVREYRRHLDDLKDRMPSSVRELAELPLHDAEILAWERNAEVRFSPPLEMPGVQPSWSVVAILSVKQEDKGVSLIYSLWDRVREFPSPAEWPFSKERRHWLYDEIDVSQPNRGVFCHRVLLSDGTTLEIPFLDVLIHRFPLNPPDECEEPRNTHQPER
jgi:hypothetical protein